MTRELEMSRCIKRYPASTRGTKLAIKMSAFRKFQTSKFVFDKERIPRKTVCCTRAIANNVNQVQSPGLIDVVDQDVNYRMFYTHKCMLQQMGRDRQTWQIQHYNKQKKKNQKKIKYNVLNILHNDLQSNLKIFLIQNALKQKVFEKHLVGLNEN